jgi:serine/threonine protein kinase
VNIDAGTRLGHYEIRSKIGEGGMGEVYLAEDLRLRRRVALKVLPPHLAADADRLHRFEREAFAASALNHPNILTIFEFGAEAQTHFLVAEFVEGLSLRQRLAGGPLPLPECLDMTIQIASALAAAHDAGIIHRDIKPDNVMVRADGYVKVLDFGLAKLAESGATGLKSDPEDQTLKQIQTRAGLVMGTAGYMSPEQARGLSVDKRSDIWSLGCVLYELLCGQTPFQGETITDTVANIIHREPASMLKLRPEANAELARIIGLCLTKNAAERYQSVRELLADLKQLQKRLELSELGHALGQSAPTEVHVAPVSNAGTNEAPAVATAAQSSPDQIRTLSQSKRRVTAIVVAVIAIAVLATVAVVVIGFYRSRSNPPALQSIAVMPFVNASGKPEVDYLSDGLTDSLIFRFSQLPEIKVSPTSSVMRFKGTAKDPAEIAKELEVDSVLSGRLMQTSDNLSISVQLIDTRTKKLVWAEQYDRKMADLMVTQREIATTVAQKMQLAGNERGVTKKYTNNNDAYQLYLKGRYHWSRRTPDDLAKAVDSYKQAIAIDANFALAYAALAEVYNSMGKQDVLRRPLRARWKSIHCCRKRIRRSLIRWRFTIGIGQSQSVISNELSNSTPIFPTFIWLTVAAICLAWAGWISP